MGNLVLREETFFSLYYFGKPSLRALHDAARSAGYRVLLGRRP